MGLALKGPFSKGKRTFWKNRLSSKPVTSFAKDECFLLGSFADKISLLKVEEYPFFVLWLFGTGVIRAGVNGAGVKFGPAK